MARWVAALLASLPFTGAMAVCGCGALERPGEIAAKAGNGNAASPALAAGVPAVLPSPPDSATSAMLQAALVALLGDRRMTLAPDAFVNASEVILERERPPGEAGRSATGRELTPSTRLRLMLQRGTCFIERADTGERVEVARLTCRPQA
jgi:hypothetical protein